MNYPMRWFVSVITSKTNIDQLFVWLLCRKVHRIYLFTSSVYVYGAGTVLLLLVVV